MKDSIVLPHFNSISKLAACSAGIFPTVAGASLRPLKVDARFSAKAASVARREVGEGSHDFAPANFARPSLISSAHGTIKRLLLTIPEYVPGSDLEWIYRDLISKLPSAIVYTVLTHSSVSDQVASWFEDLGIEVQLRVVEDRLNFTVWAEDPYVAVSYPGASEPYLVEPVAFSRYGDEVISDRVSRGGGPANTQAPLYFQGGNILVGDTFFLVGSDYPFRNLELVGNLLVTDGFESPEQTVANCFRTYLDSGRELFYVGSGLNIPKEEWEPFEMNGEEWTQRVHWGNVEGTYQPIFHIDMFITLAGRDDGGKYRVVVGSPALAAEVLGVELWPNALQEVFDDIANTLESELSFEVVRNPLPLVFLDDPAKKERTWYFASSNNALVQIAGAEHKVWLPTYGYGRWGSLAATDQRNAEIWENNLGFEVHRLGDFHPLASSNGSLHCIKKYLARE